MQPDAVLEATHKFSSHHRGLVTPTATCGCFYCESVFQGQDVADWTDQGQTALCPKCGIDSVLPENAAIRVTSDLLVKMRAYWFDRSVTVGYRRELTRRQKIIALCGVGWLASMVIMTIGDYQMSKRLPSFGDVVGYALASLVIGPLFGWLAALKEGVLGRKKNARSA